MIYQVKCELCNKVLDVLKEPYQGAKCMSCIEKNLDKKDGEKWTTLYMHLSKS